MKEKKIKYYFRPDVVIWILFGTMFCLIGIGITIFPIGTDNPSAVVSNGIQFAGLVVGIVTIFFLSINFQQQKELIEEQRLEIQNNRYDANFNRAVDLFYKQLEYANRIIARNDSLNRSTVLNNYSKLVNAEDRDGFIIANTTELYRTIADYHSVISPFKEILDINLIGKKNRNFLLNILKGNTDDILLDYIDSLNTAFCIIEKSKLEEEDKSPFKFSYSDISIKLLNEIHVFYYRNGGKY